MWSYFESPCYGAFGEDSAMRQKEIVFFSAIIRGEGREVACNIRVHGCQFQTVSTEGFTPTICANR
jgi:hypothetical protein